MIYRYIYSRPLWSIVVMMGCLILLWRYLRSACNQKWWRWLNRILFIIVVSTILGLTVFFRTSGSETKVALIPFSALISAKEQPEIYREMLMNIFLFFPVGITLPNIWSKRRSVFMRIVLTVTFGMCLSIGIECIQFIKQLGMVETDDVICNTIGVLLGTCHMVDFKRSA